MCYSSEGSPLESYSSGGEAGSGGFPSESVTALKEKVLWQGIFGIQGIPQSHNAQ